MKKRIISIAAACMLSISCLSMNNVSIDSYAEEAYYLTVEEFTDGYTKVETGNIFDDIVAAEQYGYIGYPEKYSIYAVSENNSYYYSLTPLYGAASFVISETADIEQVWNAIQPILEKYPFKHFITLDYLRLTRCCSISKADDQSIEDFIVQSESFMTDLINTGYISTIYPAGSMNSILYIVGSFEGYSLRFKDILEEYVNENLSGYSLSYWQNGMALIPDDNLTLQERFDVVQKIYEDIGIKPVFSTIDFGYDWVGNGISISENIEPTDPTEPTGTTEPTETTEAIKTTSATTTTPVETTTPTTATMPVTNPVRPVGDIDGDNKITVRDCAYIASKLAKGEKLSDIADYNKDGKVNVRDAAAIARDLAKGKI